MSDYKREVYYLYNYENRRKKNNIGFTRIEQMNGQCRMTIRMRVMSMNGKTLDVCLFVRECGEIRFLPVGTIKINNMAGECRLRLNAENILESGYSLGEMEGMVIYDSVEKFFGSEWKEQKIYFEEFKTISGKKQKKDDMDEKKEADGTGSDVKKADVKGSNGKETDVKKADGTGSDGKESDVKEVDGKKTGVEETQDGNTGKGERKEHTAVEKECVEYADGKQECETVHTMENQNKVQQQMLAAAGLECGEEENRMEKNGEMAPNKQKQENFPRRLPEIFYQCERLNPFEDDEMTDCIKIEPQDIGRLPMESWFLANNSFLLHSYYSYRHLLLARRSCGGGFEYVLCAPGICQNREEFMAAMFGFCDFKPVKKVEDKTGEFGYWYMPVVMEEIIHTD